MTLLADYQDRYEVVRVRRDDGILELTLHTDGESLQWSPQARTELCQVLGDVGADVENRVVILTGAGADFCTRFQEGDWRPASTPGQRDQNYWEGKRLLRNLVEIEVPIIAAVNGPAHIRAEIPAMCDIVLASDTASFRDPHYRDGRVPGDGVHVIWPLLLGLNRARYFQLTGQMMSAIQARDLGIVAEVMPRERLMERAWALARQLAEASTLQLRYTRVVLNRALSASLESELGYGLALESLAAVDDALSGRPGPHDEPTT